MNRWLLSLAFALAACSPAGIGGSGGANAPTDQEMLAALRSWTQLGEHGDSWFLAQDTTCQPGNLDGRDVMVCNFCEASLRVYSVRPGAIALDATRVAIGFSRVSATLARAVSAEQPNVAPTDGGGVWAIVGDPEFARASQRPFRIDELMSFGLQTRSAISLGPGDNPLIVVSPEGETLSGRELAQFFRNRDNSDVVAIAQSVEAPCSAGPTAP